MGPTQILIQNFSKQGHTLGSLILPDEVNRLIEALKERLSITGDELDLSPLSLKKLELLLADYYKNYQKQMKTLPDEEIVLLVREIATYLGQVLILHAGGKWWSSATSLSSTGIFVEGPWAITKEGQERISNTPTIFLVGLGAAEAWDTLLDGKNPRFYKTYREAISKRYKENL